MPQLRLRQQDVSCRDKRRGSIVSYDFAEKDLAHICNVLSHLEQSAAGACRLETGPMSSVDYWQTRVRAILAMPKLPAHTQKQAKDLLGRLDRLKDMRRCAASP